MRNALPPKIPEGTDADTIQRIGDICTDGSHVGTVSGKGKTISASALTNNIVENDWGFRRNSEKPQPNVRFYRYNGL